MKPAARRAWDYIIAGGGTAGCVLAARLTEDKGVRVLLLEAGGEYPLALSVPLAGMRQTTRYSWKYFTAQQRELGGRRISFPFGKVLGGSSSVNAMMYCRGTARCYDRWRELGNPGWGFSDVLPYFRKSEHQERGGSNQHGTGGPVGVSDPRHTAAFSRAFVEACLETGIPYLDDFNGEQEVGAGFYQVMQRGGRRESAATAYLRRARGRDQLRVETAANVHRVVIEDGRAVGIEFEDRTGTLRLERCDGEVILSAGALNSPKLLMLSGVGPPLQLRRCGIETLVESIGVGQNLQDHLRVPVLYESKRRSPGDMSQWVPAAIRYALQRKGVLASNCCEAGAMVRSTADADVPDLQFVTHFQSPLYPGTVDLQYCLARTASRGSITIASRDPMEPPRIDPNYLSAPGDVRLAVRGLWLAREIALAPSLQEFGLGREVMPGLDMESDLEIERHVRATAETCYHPVGTCRMGNDSGAVVDADLRVHGVQGLRVVDASVMPELPNGNTAAPVLMIAEKAADLIRGRLPAQAQEPAQFLANAASA